jgi:uncharacterized protein YprB with RNaseH-like and TPR domain
MPSLSERLQSLGVKVGTQNLQPLNSKKREDHPIQSVLPGDWWSTPNGNIFFVETRYSEDYHLGNVRIKPSSPLGIIANWAGEPDLLNLSLEQFAFIDTETTGLSGGAGTFAFLIGVGRFEKGEFRVIQFFLHDPAEEPSQLAALEEFLAPCEAIVSFNGKSFDWPIIHTRYVTNGWPKPLEKAPHLDLLHLARRLWKSRLPSRALGELEVKILGLKRSEQDVPGWMVPALYFDYLHTGDARPLRGVFYHNEIDVLSLTALLTHMSELVTNPIITSRENALDLFAVGKLYADFGVPERAIDLYREALEMLDSGEESYWQALKQLSFIYKKIGDIPKAMEYWERAAENHQIYAHIELAKIWEHQKKDYRIALHWTNQALDFLVLKSSSMDRADWEEELIYRKNRLEKKLAKNID